MRNLLQSDLSESRIADILAATAGHPALPPLGDPEWAEVRLNPLLAKWLAQCADRALAEIGEPLPALTDALYGGFFQTGERLPFENVYFERRRRLGRTAMAILLGDPATREFLLPPWIRMLGAVVDEDSWSLPAHVWTQPTGKDPMTIDLMAAETANNLAEMLVAFRAVIPADLAERIKKRLRVQMFENYLERNPPFHWTTLPMNWNAVCHQGVLGAALAVEDDHTLVARMLVRAARALPAFLSGFGNDGSTSEGPGYWSYGFGRFSELNAKLEHRTRGELSFFEGDEKIARIARFAPVLTFSGGHLVNFSDGPAKGWLSPSLLGWLGKRLSDPILAAHAAAGYRRIAETGIDVDELRADFFTLSRIALRTPSPEALANTPAPEHPDVFFKNYGAVVARGTDASGNLWEFAAKGGHNAEHHNHNDCGSFILNVNGIPVIKEIGAPEYVGDYFNSDETRYTFLAARSLGHSVPLVNGCEQQAGEQFAATVLQCELAGDFVKFMVDLTNTYPPEARCRSLVRSFLFDKRAGRLEVCDEFELEEPGLVESIVICESATLQNTPEITPASETLVAMQDLCAYNDHYGHQQSVRRLRFSRAAKSAAMGYSVGFPAPARPLANNIEGSN